MLNFEFLHTHHTTQTAIGFTALYSKLCDRLEQKDVFYTCTIPFLFFFLAFAFVIYPNVGVLHPHAFVDKIAAHLPLGFGAPLAIVRNWSFAVFYVMAEMWGSVVASLLFWSFANEVTTVEEAKKYCEFYVACMLYGCMIDKYIHAIVLRFLITSFIILNQNLSSSFFLFLYKQTHSLG